MRALVVTPTPTHPTTQGNRVRVLQIASALKRAGAIVELVYYAIDGFEQSSIGTMRDTWDVLHIVPNGGFRPRRKYPDVWGVDDWVSPSLLEATRFLASTTHYDIVVVNYVWCSMLLTLFDPARTIRILDTHDAFGDRHLLARSNNLDPHWFYTTVAEEAKGLDRADVVLAIQAEEGEYFSRIARAPVSVIEYAAVPRFMPARNGRPLTIGYLGSSNPWNVNSVQLFDTFIADKLIHVPEAQRPRLLLFGSIAKAVKNLRAFHAIGMVDDVEDAYRMMDFVVNPMVGGTGLKIKTVEALSFGRLTLSTRAGGAGLEHIHPDLRLDDIECLADRALELNAAPGAVALAAHDVQSNYRQYYDSVTERLNGLISKINDRR
jgi:glycosyltransferase involved in cell wall biosynthesis